LLESQGTIQLIAARLYKITSSFLVLRRTELGGPRRRLKRFAAHFCASQSQQLVVIGCLERFPHCALRSD